MDVIARLKGELLGLYDMITEAGADVRKVNAF